ncbi:MAG: hypothetical protein RLZZ564_588 [Pseudomonadota bacterium]|jgi:hypothetical protein
MKSIHWLVPYDNPSLDDILNSNIASIRLRLACFLRSKNYEVTFGNNIKNNPCALVIGKIGASNSNTRENLWINQITEQKKVGAKIILDYTDDHLNFESSMTSFYEKSLPYIHAAITSSTFLADKLKQKSKFFIEIIPDAIEVPIFKPKIKENVSKNIFWFGHASNIDYLIKIISKWRKLKQKTTLFILTNEQGVVIFNQSKFNIDKNLSIQLGLWSIQAMINTSKFCDLIIIPSDPSDPKKAGVSSNRLITALALGLPAAASVMESYKEYDQYFTDINSEKFIELIDYPDRFHNQVLEAQNRIIPEFTQEAIGQKWINFFEKLH